MMRKIVLQRCSYALLASVLLAGCVAKSDPDLEDASPSIAKEVADAPGDMPEPTVPEEPESEASEGELDVRGAINDSDTVEWEDDIEEEVASLPAGPPPPSTSTSTTSRGRPGPSGSTIYAPWSWLDDWFGAI